MINGVKEEERAGGWSLTVCAGLSQRATAPICASHRVRVSQELKCLLYPRGLEKATLLYHYLQMLLKNTMARVLLLKMGNKSFQQGIERNSFTLMGNSSPELTD